MKKGRHYGFTIVELLIVIVIIGILAAITVVGFSAAQDRARAASAAGDIAKASRKAGLAKALNGPSTITADLLTGDNAIKTSKGSYQLFTVCAGASGNYAAVAKARNGDVYYSVDGGAVLKDNTLNVINPCPTLGISSPSTIYGGMPASSCAPEAGSCTFSGTRTIAYGSVARGQFIAMENQTSPVTCSNAYFTDSSPGFYKACYVLEY